MALEALELKPCPFCGGEAGFVESREWDLNKKRKIVTASHRFRVHCRSCYCSTGECFYEEDAIEAWNMRAK
jgi:Lar family restriction alleviation protein